MYLTFLFLRLSTLYDPGPGWYYENAYRLHDSFWRRGKSFAPRTENRRIISLRLLFCHFERLKLVGAGSWIKHFLDDVNIDLGIFGNKPSFFACLFLNCVGPRSNKLLFRLFESFLLPSKNLEFSRFFELIVLESGMDVLVVIVAWRRDFVSSQKFLTQNNGLEAKIGWVDVIFVYIRGTINVLLVKKPLFLS